MKVIYHIFVLLLPVIFLSTTQQGELLDLTKKKVATGTEKYAPGIGGLDGGTGSKPSPLPLKVVLERLDKQQYELGNQFMYEISIENVGAKSLQIPWEPDREEALNHSADLDVLSLWLQIDELGNDAIFGVEEIYGAKSQPKTFKTLAPGGKLRFRADGIWFVGDQSTAGTFSRILPNKLNVRAHVKLDSYPIATTRFRPALSNVLSLVFRKRKDE
jgi:hypothetical protein